MESHYFADLNEYSNFLKQEKEAFVEKYNSKFISNKTRDDFELKTTIGIGSYGKVVLVKEKDTESSYYAMKILAKKCLIDTQQINHTICEKRILQCLNSSFIVYLVYFFMDNSYVYLVLPVILGGELFTHFRNDGPFSEQEAKFYAAQIFLALEYLHSLDIIYRDLKPENILIDQKGYIKLTDFGLAKMVPGRTYTLCGTPEYIAPEIVMNIGYGKAADMWSAGVLIYELCSGHTPFMGVDLMTLYEAIVSGKFKIPATFTKELRDLVKKLIQIDLTKRIGHLKDGYAEIRNHNWFKTINWVAILNYEMPATFIPEIKGPEDTDNFDPFFTTVMHSYKVSANDIYKGLFNGFL